MMNNSNNNNNRTSTPYMMGKHGATWVSNEKEPPHKKQDSGPSPSPSPSSKKLRITIRKPPSVSLSSTSTTASNDVASCGDVGCDSSDDNNNDNNKKKKRPPPVTIHDLFDIQKLIGEGGFGKVYLAIRRRDQASVALKAIPVSLPDFEETLKREVEALSALSEPGHPNVCKLYDQLRDNVHSYLSMEYIGGGELFEHLCNSGPFSEEDAAKFLRQFANGLHYIHSKGYVHSDLKPENLMMGYSWGQQVEDDNDKNKDNDAPKQPQQQLKVVDFGFSVPDQESIKLHFHGTIAYLPPECLHKKSSPRHPTAAGDMFAVGVIIYTVLTGTHPFDRTNQAPDSIIAQSIVQSAGSTYDDNDNNNNNSNNNNNNNNKSNDNDKENNEYLSKYVFDDRTQGLSASSVMLMRSLLHPDPNRRMTSVQLCRHPWILGQTATNHSLSTCSHSKLKSFWQRRFRAAIMKKFVGRSSNNGGGGALSTKEYKVIFQSMDLDGNGLVTLEELKRYMSESFGTKQTISDIFSSVDEDGNGGIDFDEFNRTMRRKFDGSDGSNCNSCNNDDNDDNDNNDDNNSKKVASEKILAISNEQVRACIFQKFSGTGTKECTNANTTTTTTTTMTREMLRTIFDTMDINKDGSLQLSEAIIGLRETPGLDEGMISSWADNTDSDLNGEIDFEEFCTAMMMRGKNEKEVFVRE